MESRKLLKITEAKRNINVNISNVISWYEESECCIFNNHVQQIPITKIRDTDVVQSIIDNYYC